MGYDSQTFNELILMDLLPSWRMSMVFPGLSTPVWGLGLH